MALTIEKLAEEVGLLLKKRNLMLTTAESCTGGGLSYWITCVPGSSEWFDRGFVTYSDRSKIEMLGVHPETIEKYGAVSEETAREMALYALERSHADISIAITGIAGPSGGVPHKQVGTVWTAWAGSSFSAEAEISLFPGNRQEIRARAIERALLRLLELIKGTG